MDATFERTMSIADAAISTALYGTLESPQDVDFYTFQRRTGDAVLLDMSIPKIDGQKNFVPSITLIGPGLNADGLDQSVTPAQLSVPAGSGTVTIDAAQEAAQAIGVASARRYSCPAMVCTASRFGPTWGRLGAIRWLWASAKCAIVLSRLRE